MSHAVKVRKLSWIGSSQDDLREFPREARRDIGLALYQTEQGLTPRSAKVLKGFGGASVLEIREDHQSDTYRAVYTVRYDEAVYVLHCFQKKSKSGIATPRPDKETIDRRLKAAREQHEKFVREAKDI